MGKKKQVDEQALIMPTHEALSGVQDRDLLFDTHTHLLSTFSTYKSKYGDAAAHDSVQAFAKDFLRTQNVNGLVDVWCEAPMIASHSEVVEAGML